MVQIQMILIQIMIRLMTEMRKRTVQILMIQILMEMA